jgi:hypothetical protein
MQVVRTEKAEDGHEVAIVESLGAALVCHHPRENMWCCCAEVGHAQCICATTLEGAVRAWHRHDQLGE